MDFIFYIKGDINGIQNFIYNVYEGKGGVAKILRARSFYISLLSQFLSFYIQTIAEKEKFQTSVITNEGGGFILKLIPEKDLQNSQESFFQLFKTIKNELEKFIFTEFDGELGISLGFSVSEDKAQNPFEDLQKSVEISKKRKFSSFFEEFFKKEKFLLKKHHNYQKCEVCKTYFSDKEVCNFCEKLKNLGGLLPKKTEFKFITTQPSEDFVVLGEINGQTYNVEFHEKKGTQEKLITVPILKKDISDKERTNFELSEDIKELKSGSIAPFEIISLYAKGDKKLGYLVVDVDNLGEVFGKIKNVNLFEKLSNELTSFFKKEVNNLATERFQPNSGSGKDLPPKFDFLENTLIYVLYTGGDDFFAIGPWDKILDFSVELNKRFKEFVKNLLKEDEDFKKLKEENIDLSKLSLSAGFVAVKPKFTIRVAAEWCKKAEKMAKKRKNAICAFGEVLSWEKMQNLIDKGKNWIKRVENKEISRRFFHRLLLLYTEMLEKRGDYMFYPIIHYIIARTVKKEYVEELSDFINKIEEKRKKNKEEGVGIKFLCNYILMATREG